MDKQKKQGILGSLGLIGLGPGNLENMTIGALEEIKAADVVVGYGVYVDQIRAQAEGKRIIETGMGGERERTLEALKEAEGGAKTVLVCSGDSSLYGLAGLAYELQAAHGLQAEIRVFPGVTSAISCNSILGAPIVEDFCTISLSDYMTPWSKIEGRLECAAKGDFAIALYNPRSKARPDGLEKAIGVLRRIAGDGIPVGVVRNAYRDGQSSWISTLGSFDCERVDMFCTVIIGNSNTKVLEGKIVTSRGYKIDTNTGGHI